MQISARYVQEQCALKIDQNLGVRSYISLALCVTAHNAQYKVCIGLTAGDDPSQTLGFETIHRFCTAGERERIVLGTDTGELLIVEGTELKATLNLDLGSTVHSIVAYAKVSVPGLLWLTINELYSLHQVKTVL